MNRNDKIIKRPELLRRVASLAKVPFDRFIDVLRNVVPNERPTHGQIKTALIIASTRPDPNSQ